MANLSAQEIDQLVKRIRTQSIIIGIIIITAIAIISFLLLKDKNISRALVFEEAKFKDTVLESTAINGIKNFDYATDILKINGSLGVLYDTAEIINYIRNVYPAVLARHELARAESGEAIPEDYKWKIAFCWAIGQDERNKDKMNFYVTPMLTNGTEVFDYFRTDNIKYYNHPKKPADPSNIYNEGQLWP